MSNHDNKKQLQRAVPGKPNYDIGYGKPPAHSRFKKGQSGNPSGRPKGSKNKLPALNEERLKTIILKEAYRTIDINEGGRKVSIPMAQAVMRSVAVNAAKGNQRVQRLFTEVLSATERDNKRLHDEWLKTAIDYKYDWEKELAYRKKHRIIGNDPIPHPDHVIIDMKTGQVNITGPLTKEEKVRWDWLRERKTEFAQSIAENKQLFLNNPNLEFKEFLLD